MGNQLLTEMDGINPAKQVFFIGATNRPDIIDPALKRPGRLDQMIFIDIPDFPARVSILKATLRKSPVDPSVDFEYLAEQTHGYSGADLAGVSKVAAKIAIRMTINAQVEQMKMKEQRRQAAEERGEEYDSDDEEEPEDAVPMITMPMLQMALKDSKRSVTQKVYQQYLHMKNMFDKEAGKIPDGGSSGVPPSAASGGNNFSAPIQPALQGDD